MPKRLSIAGRPGLDGFVPSPARSPNLWAIVAAGIRRGIITGELSPGLRLHEEALAQKFAVSRVPIREALTRLEHEGLLRIVPHRGAFVIGLTAADIHEIYDVREMIETHAVRLAVVRATQPDLNRLQELIGRMGVAVTSQRYAEVAEPDVLFHRQLVMAAAHGRLLATWESLAGVIGSLLEFTNIFHPNMPSALLSHQAIVEALSARDEAAAIESTSAHLRRGERVMQAALARLRAPADEAAGG